MTDVFVTLRPAYLGPSKGHKHGVFIYLFITISAMIQNYKLETSKNARESL